MFVKICGITRRADAMHAAAEGATALGFVFWPRSPRCVSPERAGEIVAALPAGVARVGVFVNERVDRIHEVVARARLTMVQLHGDESPEQTAALECPVVRSVTLEGAAKAHTTWPAQTLFLLDAVDPERRGGTGMRIDWRRAAGVAGGRRVILAGGLTPDNVAEAVAMVRPFGVDVSSGVEASPGVKDADKVTRFLAEARAAFERYAAR
jgi:phosphoribosylanthranilate isomerase